MIGSLYELSETVTKVVNRMLEVVTENSSSGQYYVGYDAVADLISFEDYLQYHHFIKDELRGREEVLDLDVSDDEFDIVCGLAWCKNYEGDDITSGYEDLRPAPSMAHLAEIGRKMVTHVMQHGYHTPATDLGITDEDIAFSRAMDNYPEELREAASHIKPLSADPVTTYDYEELLIRDAEAKATGGQSPVHWCFNVFGQYYGDTALSNKYPEELAQLREVMKEPRKTSSLDRTGSIIHGKPVLEFAVDVGYKWKCSYTRDYIPGAQAKMAAAQLSKIMEGYNASFQTDKPNTEFGTLLLVQIPATAPKTIREHFEMDLAKLIEDGIPFTTDISRVRTQYETALETVNRQMPELCRLRPSLKGFEEDIALEACAVLGAYTGDLHSALLHAQQNNDVERFAALSMRCDFRYNETLLEQAIDTAADRVGFRNHQWIRLATDEPGKENASFILHYGELRTILNEMGYDKDYPISWFLSGCSYEAAKEVKELYDTRQKPSLDAQMGEAKNRSVQQGREDDKDRSAPERE